MYQQLTIVGNLGNDPELRYLPSGQAVASMSVAVNRTYTRDGEKIKETTWFRASAWGKQAEACAQYLKKGARVFITGRLSSDKDSGNPRIWTGQDGAPRTSYEVFVENIVFLDSRTQQE